MYLIIPPLIAAALPDVMLDNVALSVRIFTFYVRSKSTRASLVDVLLLNQHHSRVSGVFSRWERSVFFLDRTDEDQL
jgi:hypothetical protein